MVKSVDHRAYYLEQSSSAAVAEISFVWSFRGSDKKQGCHVNSPLIMASILCQPSMAQNQEGDLTDCGEQLNSLLLPNGSCDVNHPPASQSLCMFCSRDYPRCRTWGNGELLTDEGVELVIV